MKKLEWIHGNKMKFESKHKTFNNYITGIIAGNCIGGGQTSCYIRAYNDEGEGLVDYPENKRANGVLQEYDLNEWLGKDLPNYVKDYIRKVAIDKEVISYIFYYYKNGKRCPIGYVVTTPADERKLLKAFYVGTWRAQDALNECIKYITNEEPLLAGDCKTCTFENGNCATCNIAEGD